MNFTNLFSINLLAKTIIIEEVAQAKRSDGGVLKVEQPEGPLAVDIDTAQMMNAIATSTLFIIDSSFPTIGFKSDCYVKGITGRLNFFQKSSTSLNSTCGNHFFAFLRSFRGISPLNTRRSIRISLNHSGRNALPLKLTSNL